MFSLLRLELKHRGVIGSGSLSGSVMVTRSAADRLEAVSDQEEAKREVLRIWINANCPLKCDFPIPRIFDWCMD